MDYTPISARRVLLGFGLTGFVALLPVVFIVLHSGTTPWKFAAGADGSYRGLVVTTVLMLTLALVTWLVSLAVTRLSRRPSRA